MTENNWMRDWGWRPSIVQHNLAFKTDSWRSLLESQLQVFLNLSLCLSLWPSVMSEAVALQESCGSLSSHEKMLSSGWNCGSILVHTMPCQWCCGGSHPISINPFNTRSHPSVTCAKEDEIIATCEKKIEKLSTWRVAYCINDFQSPSDSSLLYILPCLCSGIISNNHGD